MTRAPQTISSRPLAGLCIALALTLLLLGGLAWSSFQVVAQLDELQGRNLRLEQLRGEIARLDEILRTSAHIAAITGEPAWEKRHEAHSPQLRAAIEEAQELAPAEQIRDVIAQTQASNVILGATESRVFEYVREQRLPEACAILFTPRYQNQRLRYGASLTVLDAELKKAVTSAMQARVRPLKIAMLICGGALPIILLSWWIALRAMVRWRAALGANQATLARHSTELLKANADLDRKVLEHARAQRQAEEANRAKSQFLANMSHEIRTPMNGVLGMTDLLLDTPLAPDQYEIARTIQSSGRALLTVINDVLDVSKVEAGKLTLNPAQIDLRTIARQAVRALGVLAQAKKLRLHVDVDPRLPRWVLGDPDRLRQILNNLVGNAVKFTDEGQIRVRIAVLETAEAVTLVRCEVRDTGIGIPPDQIDRLFHPFEQLDNSSTRRHGGTGLGLSIVKHLVEMMGGTTGVSSIEGVGSTFWFTIELPIATGVPAESVVPEPSISPVQRAARGGVLVVDDNEVNRKVVCRLLEKLGYETRTARDGREAIQAWETGRFDLILMDCQMPEVDGYEATREIRRRELNGRRIPIVALTAHALKDAEAACRAAGMDGYLTKPIDRSQLNAMLERYRLIDSSEPTAVSIS